MATLSDKKILQSWHKNVSPWTAAIQDKVIPSRILVTDQAITDTVASLQPETVLDIGCGEGWLARSLADRGMKVTGIDAVAGLIDKARRLSAVQIAYEQLAYEELSATRITDHFDLAVCNFSLLGKESVEHVFKTIPQLLNPGGHFVVQTLHPLISCGESAYEDSWREGSWAGFSDEFTDPAPWYFRTIESWTELFVSNGLSIQQLKEPVHPESGQPASLIIVSSVP